MTTCFEQFILQLAVSGPKSCKVAFGALGFRCPEVTLLACPGVTLERRLGIHRNFLRVTPGKAPSVMEACPEVILGRLQNCFKGVTEVYQMCFRSVSKVSQRCLRCVPEVFQKCFISVSEVSQGCP